MRELEEVAVQVDRMGHHRVIDQGDAHPLAVSERVRLRGLLAEFLPVETPDAPRIAVVLAAREVLDDASDGSQLAERTGTTMQEFLKRVTVRKIDRLSTLITESFLYLLRKASFVKRIRSSIESPACTTADCRASSESHAAGPDSAQSILNVPQP